MKIGWENSQLWANTSWKRYNTGSYNYYIALIGSRLLILSRTVPFLTTFSDLERSSQQQQRSPEASTSKNVSWFRTAYIGSYRLIHRDQSLNLERKAITHMCRGFSRWKSFQPSAPRTNLESLCCGCFIVVTDVRSNVYTSSLCFSAVLYWQHIILQWYAGGIVPFTLSSWPLNVSSLVHWILCTRLEKDRILAVTK